MGSLTFEGVIKSLMERSSDPVDREVCKDALELNCLWVDQIAEARRCVVLRGLLDVFDDQLKSGIHADDEVAVLQIRRASDELLRRYPDCFG